MINPEMDFPEEINPSSILANIYCEIIKFSAQKNSLDNNEMFFKLIKFEFANHYFDKILKNATNSEKIFTVDFIASQLKKNKFHHEKFNNLKRLAQLLLEKYHLRMTQTYAGYTFPCDAMIKFAIAQIESNYSGKGPVNIPNNCNNFYYWKASLLYCAARNYQISSKIPGFVSKDTYSKSLFFKNRKLVIAFKRLCEERRFAAYAYEQRQKEVSKQIFCP